jgi:hypothetical protein
MASTLVALAPAPVAEVPFRHLGTLWLQITGTWCNLACTHCINASGPRDPWLAPLEADVARAAIREGERLGVKEIYVTGGEPFLHPQILPLLEEALGVAPVTVLTNGTLITRATAEALAALAAASPYSLELRVSVDDVEAEGNDRVRGPGAFRRALRAIRLLDAAGLLPILTATEARPHAAGAVPPAYEAFRDLLRAHGIRRPRVKILPGFPVGRLDDPEAPRLAPAELAGFDTAVLQCADSRVVAADGVYACPILAGLPGARLSTGSLEASFRPASLYHPACVTCHRTGISCRT